MVLGSCSHLQLVEIVGMYYKKHLVLPVKDINCNHTCIGKVTASVFLGFFACDFGGAGFWAAQHRLSFGKPLQTAHMLIADEMQQVNVARTAMQYLNIIITIVSEGGLGNVP